MLYKYQTPRHTKEEVQAYTRKTQLSYWGIFVVYLAIWFLVWRMCVQHEAM
jgi:hypothetical protein